MSAELPASLRQLALFQQGILTTNQAIDGGLTRYIIRSRLRRGDWQQMQTGVYAVFSGEPARLAILWAAVLRAGPGAMLSRHTAAELDALADQQSSLIHITLPAGRHIDRFPGVVLHRSDRADEARHPMVTPPRTRIEETVLDLVDSSASVDAAFTWITRALGRRLTTQARLTDAMTKRMRLRWRLDLAEALSSDWAGVHSGLEDRYLRDVERPHNLPRGVRQARVRRGGRTEYRDVLYEAQSVAVELDGRVAHPGDMRWPDIHRDNAAAVTGVITLRYGWLDVSQHPCRVAAQVAQVLRRQGYTGCRGCSRTCPVWAAVRS